MYLPEFWDELDQIIWKEHDNKCIVCGSSGDTIHEIVPKSKNPRNWTNPKNRVVVCHMCHRKIHNEGPANWSDSLTEKRNKIMENKK